MPATGGVILAANHISHADPLVLADCVLFGSRPDRPLPGQEHACSRGAASSGRSCAVRTRSPCTGTPPTPRRRCATRSRALQAGECIVIYPEGTVSRDAGKWPMAARTGVARLALLSGAPVVPVAQWGSEEILDSYRRKGLHLLPRQPMHVLAGPPVDLSAWQGQELTAEVLRGATEAVMRDLTGLVEQLRGEPAPETVHVRQRSVDERSTA